MAPQTESSTLELRPIRGPSAFGGEARRFWNLIWLTAAADYKTRYLNSWLGYAWSLLRPLLFFAVLYVVFTRVVRFGGEIENYAALLLLNIMLFSSSRMRLDQRCGVSSSARAWCERCNSPGSWSPCPWC